MGRDGTGHQRIWSLIRSDRGTSTMLSALSRRNKVTALGARYRVHRERRHLSQRLRQPQTAGDQARQLADPGPQVGGISADLFGGQRPGGAVDDLGELRRLCYLRSLVQPGTRIPQRNSPTCPRRNRHEMICHTKNAAASSSGPRAGGGG
jgi:hypothetical protein